jgi:hypothetical protein
MPKDEEDPKKPSDQVVCYREPCVKFTNNKRMTNLCVLILAFLLLILLPGWAVAGLVEGSIQGLTVVTRGMLIPEEKKERVFVIVTADKKYYFLMNVDRAFLARYQNSRVRVIGDMHPVYQAIKANKIELFRGGRWKTIWPFSMLEEIKDEGRLGYATLDFRYLQLITG